MCVVRELCDIGDIGKLTREQFALALHLINQKITKGLDPPQSLSPEMIPPSDRQNIKQVSHSQAVRSQNNKQGCLNPCFFFFIYFKLHVKVCFFGAEQATRAVITFAS